MVYARPVQHEAGQHRVRRAKDASNHSCADVGDPGRGGALRGQRPSTATRARSAMPARACWCRRRWADTFIERFKKQAGRNRSSRAIRSTPATTMGPLVTQEQQKARAGLHRSGPGDLGRQARDGRPRKSPTGFSAGKFTCRPTLFTGVKSSMKIAQGRRSSDLWAAVDPVQGRGRCEPAIAKRFDLRAGRQHLEPRT